MKSHKKGIKKVPQPYTITMLTLLANIITALTVPGI